MQATIFPNQNTLRVAIQTDSAVLQGIICKTKTLAGFLRRGSRLLYLKWLLFTALARATTSVAFAAISCGRRCCRRADERRYGSNQKKIFHKILS
jgi:hypothetical protein